jgi:hypothetical protein
MSPEALGRTVPLKSLDRSKSWRFTVKVQTSVKGAAAFNGKRAAA